jgi:hypothetical protein
MTLLTTVANFGPIRGMVANYWSSVCRQNNA